MRLISRTEYNKQDPLAKSQHPDQVLLGLLSFIEGIGSHKFLTGAGYNTERDSLIAVLFAYAIRKWTRQEWFLQQITDPPDFYMISPTSRSRKPLDRMGIEVVEIKTVNPEEAIEIIQRTKLQNYAPGRGTTLLVFLNCTNAIRVGSELCRWSIQNREKFNKFSELYFLYLMSFSPDTTWTYRIINIFKPWNQVCNLSEEFNKGVIFPHPLINKYQVKITEEEISKDA